MNLEQFINPIGISPATSLPLDSGFCSDELFEKDCRDLTTKMEPVFRERVEELKLLERLNNCATLEDISKLDLDGLGVGFTKKVAAAVDETFPSDSPQMLVYKTVLCFTAVTAMADAMGEYIMHNVNQRAGRIEWENHNPSKKRSPLILPPDAS